MASEISSFILVQWQQPEKRYPFFVTATLSAIIIFSLNLAFWSALGVVVSCSLLSIAAIPLVQYITTVANKISDAIEHADELLVEANRTIVTVNEKVIPALKETIQEQIPPQDKPIARRSKQRAIILEAVTIEEEPNSSAEENQPIEELKNKAVSPITPARIIYGWQGPPLHTLGNRANSMSQATPTEGSRRSRKGFFNDDWW